MKDIAEFIVSLFQGLRVPFRWIAFALIALVIMFSVIEYEQLTGHFYFSKLEKKISLLGELQTLKSSGIDKNPELYTIYESLVNDLDTFEIKVIAMPNIAFNVGNKGDALGKAISFSAIWVIILAIGIPIQIRKDRKVTGMTIGIAIFLLAVIVLFGWIGSLIPTIYNPWVNFIVFPILQIIALAYLTRKPKSTS